MFLYYKRVPQLLTIQHYWINGNTLHFTFSQTPFHFNTSAENAFRLFGQYLNPAVVQRLVACTGPKVALKQPRGQFDEAHFWTFVNTLLVMFISPRRSLQEYWADDEILNNAYVKKMGSQDQFALVHGCISWEEDDGDLGRNWLQEQIISTVQRQMLASYVEKADRFLEDSWNGFESQAKENDPKEFPYLHLPIHSDVFQKTVLQQKQQTKYYRRVLKQEQPLTEKQVKNINQMKTQDEHYKQLIAYIQFDHKIVRPQAQQFVYCLQVCIINSFLIFRQRCSEPKDNHKQEQNRLPSIRDYVQLLIKQIEPKSNWAKKEEKYKKQVNKFVNNIVTNHYLISLREIRIEVKDPRTKCDLCNGIARHLCSCNIGLCMDCYTSHCLEQQLRQLQRDDE
ncbi:Transposase_IS4 [Hexamita inflata]|uniref:Transposase_IS4 n=1 Tax=Hexamita inflata TaxID=28002 RepID=A0ABP1I8I8_9EUKA